MDWENAAMGSESRFLVVEDDPTDARTITRALGKLRPTVHARDLHQGRNALRRHDKWCGFVIDVVLPDGIGLDLLKEIRADLPTVPAIVLTSKVDSLLINLAFSLGAPYVCKPVDPEAVRAFGLRAVAFAEVGEEAVSGVVNNLAEEHSLTNREVEILSASVAGVARDALSGRQGVTENTVKAQVRSLLQKCDARNLLELSSDVLRRAIEKRPSGRVKGGEL